MTRGNSQNPSHAQEAQQAAPEPIAPRSQSERQTAAVFQKIGAVLGVLVIMIIG